MKFQNLKPKLALHKYWFSKYNFAWNPIYGETVQLKCTYFEQAYVTSGRSVWMCYKTRSKLTVLPEKRLACLIELTHISRTEFLNKGALTQNSPGRGTPRGHCCWAMWTRWRRTHRERDSKWEDPKRGDPLSS